MAASACCSTPSLAKTWTWTKARFHSRLLELDAPATCLVSDLFVFVPACCRRSNRGLFAYVFSVFFLFAIHRKLVKSVVFAVFVLHRLARQAR